MRNITKEEKIELCGKKTVFIRGKNGIVFSIPDYCNQRGCTECDNREAYRRKKQISELFMNHRGDVYRAIINNDRWTNIGVALSSANASYISVQIEGDKRVLYCDRNPYKKKDIGLISVSASSAKNELTQKNMLLPAVGSRSSGGDWRVTEEREVFSEEICVVEFVPCFHPTEKMAGKITKEFTDNIFAHANTWTRGKVSVENVQEFMNHSTNKAISMAICQGARLHLDGCRMQTKIIGKERIDSWSTAIVSEPNLKTTGKSAIFSGEAYLLQINAKEPHDHIGDYLAYLEEENESRLRDELGAAYLMFYPGEAE